MRLLLRTGLAFVACVFLSQTVAAEPLKALIVDGQNNHGNWPQTTQMMKKYLEDSGLFLSLIHI